MSRIKYIVCDYCGRKFTSKESAKAHLVRELVVHNPKPIYVVEVMFDALMGDIYQRKQSHIAKDEYKVGSNLNVYIIREMTYLNEVNGRQNRICSWWKDSDYVRYCRNGVVNDSMMFNMTMNVWLRPSRNAFNVMEPVDFGNFSWDEFFNGDVNGKHFRLYLDDLGELGKKLEELQGILPNDEWLCGYRKYFEEAIGSRMGELDSVTNSIVQSVIDKKDEWLNPKSDSLPKRYGLPSYKTYFQAKGCPTQEWKYGIQNGMDNSVIIYEVEEGIAEKEDASPKEQEKDNGLRTSVKYKCDICEDELDGSDELERHMRDEHKCVHAYSLVIPFTSWHLRKKDGEPCCAWAMSNVDIHRDAVEFAEDGTVIHSKVGEKVLVAGRQPFSENVTLDDVFSKVFYQKDKDGCCIGELSRFDGSFDSSLFDDIHVFFKEKSELPDALKRAFDYVRPHTKQVCENRLSNYGKAYSRFVNLCHSDWMRFCKRLDEQNGSIKEAIDNGNILLLSPNGDNEYEVLADNYGDIDDWYSTGIPYPKKSLGFISLDDEEKTVVGMLPKDDASEKRDAMKKYRKDDWYLMNLHLWWKTKIYFDVKLVVNGEQRSEFEYEASKKDAKCIVHFGGDATACFTDMMKLVRFKKLTTKQYDLLEHFDFTSNGTLNYNSIIGGFSEAREEGKGNDTN